VNIPKQYDPKAVEPKWSEWWLENNIFKSDPNPDKDPFVILMPPPNVTGVLHMGHALQDTIQDTLIRYYRMLGYEAHWQPGKDHAGIATQTVVEKELAKAGKPDRVSLGREKFIEEVWELVKRNRDTITKQKMALGDSADWTRERFTLDEGLSRAVREVFVKLYEEGLIYRGPYIVNWSPALQSAISDEEVDHKDEEGNLWYIRYPGTDGGEGVVVATTRPETMLGDVAVMVHPDDERYKELIGKEVELPLTGRNIPVIADDYVDREFGTGVVKVTPAHDPNDFEVGRRHNLPMPVILDTSAKIKAPAPDVYIGLDRFDARETIIKDLEALNLLVKTEKYQHSVGYCQRSKVPIEPYLSTQWFMKMKPLAEPALDAVRDGRIKFVPGRWAKVYFHWLENIRDWCISRQLWWGHRIPAWHCDECGHVTVPRIDPDKCEKCGSEKIRRDEDVLDTWFSSWLWPFSTLGWPDDTEEMKYYHPTDVLVSGYDIIFFWIARMIMADLHFTGDIPFKTVYITGMIKDKQGRWMSKSLGNGIDPLEMIDKYGADAVRYSLVVLTTEGQDINLDPTRFEMGRNFANKIWNAFRFLTTYNLNSSESKLQLVEKSSESKLQLEEKSSEFKLQLVDQWIEGRFIETTREVEQKLKRYRLNEALLAIYRFTWNDFCDWYIEAIKPRISKDAIDQDQADATLRFAYKMMERIIRLLHPFMPFMTEEIYQALPQVEGLNIPEDRPVSIAIAEYPIGKDLKADTIAVEEFSYIKELISSVRTVRGELKVPPSKQAKLLVNTDDLHNNLIEREWNMISRLAKLESWDTVEEKPSQSASTVVAGRRIFIPIADLIDIDVEIKRVEKEINKLEGHFAGIEKKLANKKFVNNAPEAVVNREKEKMADLEMKLDKLKNHLKDLSN